jgi:predicted PurR-regulated permease PerM
VARPPRATISAFPLHLPENTDRFTWFVRLASFVLIVTVLRLAQDVLLPMAFAVLLAFLLSPLVLRLNRWGLPRTLAIILTVSVAFAGIGGIGWLVTSQVLSLSRELPKYEENIRQKLAALKRPEPPPAVSRMAGMVENLKRELQAPETPPPADKAGGNESRPVPVEVHSPEPRPWEVAREIVSPILRPLGIAGIVIVFVVAMLFQRDDLRDRFVKLVSAGKINVATEAIDDAGSRVSRYLGMQLVVNACYGLPIGLGLYLIGIPNAVLWGLLATILRFIPFVGPWIAAAFPLAVAVAIDPGWTKFLYALGLFIVMEIISNNIIEVILYGASTGISNFALLLAAVFWTWLWGPAGLVLSTPLTVCVLVLGNYVAGMSFLSMLLGSEPVHEPPTQFYQRMLSMESEEMFDLAEKYIAEHSLEEFYNAVFVPALLLSEEDRHSGSLAEARQHFIFQSSRELIEELERRDENTAPQPTALIDLPPARIVVLPARDEADELVALMLGHLLRRRGVSIQIHSLTTPLEQTLRQLEGRSEKIVFISALPPSAVAAARHAYHRLHARRPNAPVVIGIWRRSADLNELGARMHLAAHDRIVTDLSAAIGTLEGLLRPAKPEPAAPAGEHHPKSPSLR